ncbi:uncharacterized protein [Antennarius striatus]|uniref:uncharacterized protein n=1 Tax=Antennarius striatus TaxID=241820 RepID=UPI0035B4BB5A
MQQICDSNSLIMDVSICSDQQMCNGGSCSYHPFCNVIGPGVIDFFGNTITVVDECTYRLLSHENIIISTKFGPRRRDGISFPDKVTISTPDQITGSLELSEDGTLLIGGAEPDDTNTPASVTISENDLGVTIEITGSGFKVVLFYNGQYIQIFITGGVAQMTTGLCRDSDSLSSSMSDLSLTGCMEVPDQDPDETIDALVVEQQCNVLSESILFPCFSISHTPYENLCNDILNIYPQLDGFNCPFQEAYARACELNGHTLGDWRSQISCDVHDVFCPDDTCVLDEFCGDTDNGVRGCRCRGSMTGLPATVCDGSAHTAVATLPTCQFTERGFDFTGLHLNDPTCVPKINNVAKIITFTMDDNDRCGAIITTNEFNEYIVKNTISNSNSGRRSAINTGDGVNIAFACVFEEPEVKTLSFTPVGNSINMELSFGEWLYTLTFDAFIDDAFTQPVGGTIGLSSKIWVKIATTGLEGAMVAVLTESCWATSEASPDAGTRFDLITNGCGVTGDVVVDMTGNGMGISNSFCFRIFEFSDSPGNFYLHCQVRLCQNECIPSCGARRRRSNRMTLLNETLPIMSLVWSK